MGHKLEQGIPLFIIGAQGTGKSVLARSIAAEYGPFIEVEAANIHEVLDRGAATVIVDGIPDEVPWHALAGIMRSPSHELRRKHRPILIVKTPYFIFCVQDAAQLRGIEMARLIVREQK